MTGTVPGRLDPAEARARSALRSALADLEPGDAAVLAVSGGADSLALAAAAAFVAPRDGWRAMAVVVDHGLQDGSADVAARAAAACRSLGLEAETVQVVVEGPGGPEAAARRARHQALRAAAERHAARAVLLAHTLDDQAETVLLGLGRGSGARSIAGMAATAGLLRRPFLGLRRAETERVCAVHGLEPWADPHNEDPAFRRVRVRREVLPLLEDVLGGGAAEALARTAAQACDDADHLDAVAADWLARHGLDARALAAEPPAVRRRVLHRAALAAGARPGELAAVHVAALDRLVVGYRGQRRVELPGPVACSRTGDHLTFSTGPVAG